MSSSLLWLDRNQKVFSDSAGTTPATVTGTVGCWTAVGGAWGTDQFVQATGSLQPTLQSDGLRSDGVDDILVSGSSIVVSGNFTMYSVISRTVNTHVVPWLGFNSATDAGIVTFGTQTYFTGDSGGGFGQTDNDTGLTIRRVRRSGTVVFLKVGTNAEISFDTTISPNMTVRTVIGRNADTANTAARVRQVVLVTKLITPTDADDTAIINKLLALEPTAAWS